MPDSQSPDNSPETIELVCSVDTMHFAPDGANDGDNCTFDGCSGIFEQTKAPPVAHVDVKQPTDTAIQALQREIRGRRRLGKIAATVAIFSLAGVVAAYRHEIGAAIDRIAMPTSGALNAPAPSLSPPPTAAPVEPAAADAAVVDATSAAAPVPANCPEKIRAACTYKGPKEAVTCVVDDTKQEVHATVVWAEAKYQPKKPAARGTLKMKFTGCPELTDTAQFVTHTGKTNLYIGERTFRRSK